MTPTQIRGSAISYPILSKLKLKSFAKLLHKKAREESQEFLAEGVRLCEELLLSSLESTAVIFTPRLLESPNGAKLLQQAEQHNLPIWQTDEVELQKLAETEHPQPILVCARMRHHQMSPQFLQQRRVLILMDITDPGNVGTLIRTAEAFGWDGMIATGTTADIYNSKVLRAAMGAAFRFPFAYAGTESLLSCLEDTSVPSVVSVPRNGMVSPFSSLPDRFVLILGNEAHGVPAQWIARANWQVTLPMVAPVESLNVAVAGGILLFLLR